jgi:hypothetical protein
MNVELMKTMQHPWENLNKVEETPAGKISTFYFLDNWENLQFGSGCCHPPKIGEQTDMVQSRYFGSNTSGNSGCLCMAQDLASSLAHRAGNI